MKINSLISGGVLFKHNKSCESVKLLLPLVWLNRPILLYRNELDIVFEENQQGDSDKNKQMDQTA